MRAMIWRWADRLINLSALVGIIGLMTGVVDILIDVVGRAFHAPLTGAQDISQMAMVTMVFGGMALADRMEAHISVDILEPVFPRAINRATQVFAPALGAVVFLMLAKTMWDAAALSRMLHLATNIIYLPKAWFQYMAMVMSIITALAMFLRAVDTALGRPMPKHDLDEAI